MSATKRDFERMAEYIRLNTPIESQERMKYIMCVVSMLSTLYPKFNEDKFRRACVKQGVEK